MALVTSHTKQPGRRAPDFDLLGVDLQRYTLKDAIFSKWLCIVFTCNHCPYAKASWAPLIELSYTYGQIACIAINSNDAIAYPEDSFDNMIACSKMYGLPFPYLHDTDQCVARAYDAQCTPDVYLFKNTGGVFELFYHWRINDNRQDPLSVVQKNLEEHCQKLLADEQPSDIWPPSIWCSIKRRDTFEK